MEHKVIALGFFDGVHLGHGQLLRRAREQAAALGVSSAALTFDTHPDTLVFGSKVPLLSGPKDREYLVKSLYELDQLLTLPFDRATRDMPWEDFLRKVLLEKYGACHLVCGHDFRFGAGGRGTAETLKKACGELGVGCDVIPEYKLEGVTVSSTYIRGLLAAGELDRAVRFLGHPYILSGRVVSGARIGRTMQTPTANVETPPGILLPARGVYACRAQAAGGTYLAVTNVGTRPTVQGQSLTVEPWLLDFDGDLYGQELRLEFYHFLRPEKKFPDLEALHREILHNADQTRAFFGKNGK